nr:biotin--[acetyl-CoA-carboxylase] ligase [uncultured Desulfobulbus sp.]
MKIFVEQTESTNLIAREKGQAGAPDGTVVWTESQHSGRGQYGRVFASPKGGLYFSLILRPQFDAQHVPLITLVTGLACRDVLHATYTVDLKIKWPNDLYLNGKKVGGILCENSFDTGSQPPWPMVIVGVGINVNSRLADFPAELHPILTTLQEETGQSVELESLLDRLRIKICALVDTLPDNRESLLDRWQNYDYLLHRPVKYLNGEQVILGTGCGIAADGRYTLRDASGLTHTIIGGQLRPAE